MLESLIQHIKKHIVLSDEKLASLSPYLELRTYKKKEVLLREETLCKEKYFLNSGCLQVYYVKSNGIEQTIDFALENWWTTDFAAFAKGEKAQLSIRAIETSEVLVLSYEQQERLLKVVPELERYFHLIFQRAYAASQHRIKLLYELSREELYHHFRNHYPGFLQRVPQYMIASFLGFTPEYLSEIRKKRIS